MGDGKEKYVCANCVQLQPVGRHVFAASRYLLFLFTNCCEECLPWRPFDTEVYELQSVYICVWTAFHCKCTRTRKEAKESTKVKKKRAINLKIPTKGKRRDQKETKKGWGQTRSIPAAARASPKQSLSQRAKVSVVFLTAPRRANADCNGKPPPPADVDAGLE